MDSKLAELSAKVENMSKQLSDMSKIIGELKNEEVKKVVEVNQNKFKKRKFNKKYDEFIQKLIVGKKKSLVWKLGMSKYINITKDTNNKWLLQSSIFNEHNKFKSREEAELYYEKILDKYDIDYDYITRNEYVAVNESYNDAIDGLILISSK